MNIVSSIEQVHVPVYKIAHGKTNASHTNINKNNFTVGVTATYKSTHMSYPTIHKHIIFRSEC